MLLFCRYLLLGILGVSDDSHFIIVFPFQYKPIQPTIVRWIKTWYKQIVVVVVKAKKIILISLVAYGSHGILPKPHL